MKAIDAKGAWEEYRARELRSATPFLDTLGFILDEKQVHIGGERYLMAGARDVGGGGQKLVLTGRRKDDNLQVIIKVSSDPAGMREIEREHDARSILRTIEFAVRAFHSPKELLYTKEGRYRIYVTTYVKESVPFFDHSLDEQFFLALHALETQEGVHATTRDHASRIKNVFGIADVDTYLASYHAFAQGAEQANPDDAAMARALARGEEFLHAHRVVIERYSGFLTHADFVPNNMRVSGNEIYLLDYASMYFGNKYESWARFINFMIQHNTALEHLLVRYVRENRGAEEYLSLRLMRVYKIGFLLRYYSRALNESAGDLHTLTLERIRFWTEALSAVLEDRPVSPEFIEHYWSRMERLRSEEEKDRQRQMLGDHIRV